MANKSESDFVASVNRGLRGLLFVSPGLSSKCPECVSAYNYRDKEDEDGNVTETAEDQFESDYESGKLDDEGGFSKSRCDCCGSGLGGDRYSAHGFFDGGTLDGKICHLDICADCLAYLANGDLPQ